MPSESHARFEADPSGRSRSTCPTCKMTVCVYVINGKKVLTDTERLTVVPDEINGSKLNDARSTVVARRLHSESCARYVLEQEREELRKQKLEWEREQKRSGPRPGSRGRGL
jgi:hypothetical protein